MHQSINSNPTALRRLPTTLAHKGETIQHVNAALKDVGDQATVETILIAVFILWMVNFEETSTNHEDPILFTPYLPGANWLSVYGRAEVVDAHAAAFRWLVERIGGLERIRLPGLAQVLAMYVIVRVPWLLRRCMRAIARSSLANEQFLL